MQRLCRNTLVSSQACCQDSLMSLLRNYFFSHWKSVTFFFPAQSRGCVSLSEFLIYGLSSSAFSKVADLKRQGGGRSLAMACLLPTGDTSKTPPPSDHSSVPPQLLLCAPDKPLLRLRAQRLAEFDSCPAPTFSSCLCLSFLIHRKRLSWVLLRCSNGESLYLLGFCGEIEPRERTYLRKRAYYIDLHGMSW